MPIINSSDSKGPFYQFGTTGKKYYYTPTSTKSKHNAKSKALRQGRAIEASKHRLL